MRLQTGSAFSADWGAWPSQWRRSWLEAAQHRRSCLTCCILTAERQVAHHSWCIRSVEFDCAPLRGAACGVPFAQYQPVLLLHMRDHVGHSSLPMIILNHVAQANQSRVARSTATATGACPLMSRGRHAAYETYILANTSQSIQRLMTNTLFLAGTAQYTSGCSASRQRSSFCRQKLLHCFCTPLHSQHRRDSTHCWLAASPQSVDGSVSTAETRRAQRQLGRSLRHIVCGPCLCRR